MTGRNLPPTTGREISGLKRRVSDLERMLDRIRRKVAAAPTNTFNTPYAQLEGGDDTTLIVPGDTTVLTPNRAAVLDPTGHILVDYEDATHGWFVFQRPGFYEVGGTVRFIDNECVDESDRWLTIARTHPDGGTGPLLSILEVGRAAGGSILSGSRMVYVDLTAATRWHLAAGHDDDHDLSVQCDSFWTRFVTTGEPTPIYTGST